MAGPACCALLRGMKPFGAHPCGRPAVSAFAPNLSWRGNPVSANAVFPMCEDCARACRLDGSIVELSLDEALVWEVQED